MFHPDGLLIRFLTKVCDLLLLNLALVLSCVTVVFSGTAVTSLYTVTLKMIRGQDYTPIKDFLRALRENFLPSFPAAIMLFVDVTLLAVLRAAFALWICICTVNGSIDVWDSMDINTTKYRRKKCQFPKNSKY